MTSTIRSAIIMILDNHDGEIQGTEALARETMLINNKSYLVSCVRILETDGQLSIIPSNGGRGKKTVYKRNRNQPGMARRVRKTR